MSRFLLVVALLTGCDRVFALNHLPDPAVVDGSEADVNAALCFGKYAPGALLSVCLDAPPPATRALSSLVDTGGAMTECDKQVSQAGGPDLCVIAAQTIIIDTLVRAHGARPLVLVATERLLIKDTGGIDVSSGRGSGPGAGANEPSCGRAGDGVGSTTTYGGGAGGSFGSIGASGGNGGNGALGGAPVSPVSVLGAVRGGCKGGDGGPGFNAGPGGGAVYLIAGIALDVRGLIDASGGGGGGSVQIHYGGGGGGTGGLIALDSPLINITNTARLVANGGGGGGGGDSTTGQGGNGAEANLTADPFPASGGAGGGTTGGGGGKGSDRTTAAGKGSNGKLGTNGGGGGGGGGLGFIRAYAGTHNIDAAAQISPVIP